jgi:hypothetical protein
MKYGQEKSDLFIVYHPIENYGVIGSSIAIGRKNGVFWSGTNDPTVCKWSSR